MSSRPYQVKKSLGPLSPADVPVEALPVVELSKEDIESALDLAKNRNKSYDAINGGTVFGNQNSLSSHQTGLLGELAVADLFGLSVDTSTYDRGDNGKDHTLFGQAVDVKATATKKMSRPELLVRADKEVSSDIYILAHIIEWDSSGARVRLIGRASKELVTNRTPRCHPGRKRNYVVAPDEMDFLPFLRPTES